MDTRHLDKSLTILQSNKDRWAMLSISEKIDFLDHAIDRTVDHAEEWAMAGIEAKGLDSKSPLSSEEWMGGP